MHPKRLANIAAFELVRLFLTKRGLLTVAAFSVCWLLILRYPIGQSVGLISSPEFSDYLDSAFGAIGLSKLLTWPEAELVVFWIIALYTFPSFCLFLCGDQTVGDRTRGTLRFLTLRATRRELLLGRFLGQVMILAVLLLLTIGATLAMLSYRDPTLFSSGLVRSAELFGLLLMAVMPFIALMSLFNTFASSARIAFIFAILFFTGGKIMLALLTWQFPALSVLGFIFPGYQVDQMAGQNATMLLSVGLPVLQTVVLLILAERVFARSSI